MQTAVVAGSVSGPVQQPQPIRLLICGDVEGNFQTLANNLAAVQRKQGPFSFALCVGRFFAPPPQPQQPRVNSDSPAAVSSVSSEHQSSSNDVVVGDGAATGAHIDGLRRLVPESLLPFVDGSAEFSIPIFFIDTLDTGIGKFLRRYFWDGCRLCKNLEFLGTAGRRIIASLNIGYLSGSGGIDRQDANRLGDTWRIASHRSDRSDDRSPPSASEAEGVRRLLGPSLPGNVQAMEQFVAAGSGQNDSNDINTSHDETSSSSSAAAESSALVDILVTPRWPQGLWRALDQNCVENFRAALKRSPTVAHLDSNLDPAICCPDVADLAELLEPRYHISACGGIFFQRPCYKTTRRGHACRFISLGSFSHGGRNSQDKALKHIHALLLRPAASVAALPPDTTQSPFSALAIASQSADVNPFTTKSGRPTSSPALPHSPSGQDVTGSVAYRDSRGVAFDGRALSDRRRSPHIGSADHYHHLQRNGGIACDASESPPKRLRLPDGHSGEVAASERHFARDHGVSAEETGRAMGVDRGYVTMPVGAVGGNAEGSESPWRRRQLVAGSSAGGAAEFDDQGNRSTYSHHHQPPCLDQHHAGPPESSHIQSHDSAAHYDNHHPHLSSSPISAPPWSQGAQHLPAREEDSSSRLQSSAPPPPPHVTSTTSGAGSGGGSPHSAGGGGGGSASGCVVIVTNIPYMVDANSFAKIMTTFGQVMHLSMPKTSDGLSCGRAWVTYQSPAEAQKAIQSDGKMVSAGRRLRVALSTSTGLKPHQLAQHRQQQSSSTGGVAFDVRPHADCWFCLANPSSEKQLVVSVGDQVYVALAKGGLLPQHLLIVPITHFPNSAFAPPEVAEEMTRFISALRKCFADQGMCVLVFERFFRMKSTKGMHTQIQVIPVPAHQAAQLSDRIEQDARKLGLMDCPSPPQQPPPPTASSSELPAVQHHSHQESPLRLLTTRTRLEDCRRQAYYYIELPAASILPSSSSSSGPTSSLSPSASAVDGGGRGEYAPVTKSAAIRRLLLVTQANARLPLNFCRDVAAEVAGRPERAVWQNCVVPAEEEARLASEMRERFAPYELLLGGSPSPAGSASPSPSSLAVAGIRSPTRTSQTFDRSAEGRLAEPHE